jgi:hypothetical protein
MRAVSQIFQQVSLFKSNRRHPLEFLELSANESVVTPASEKDKRSHQFGVLSD